MDKKKSLLSTFDAAASFSESSSILPEDTVKLVYCILDEICSNLTRNEVQEDVALLPLLMCVENAFCRRHYHIFQTLTGEDVHSFVTWCFHRLVWVAVRGSFRQVYASIAAAAQLFSALECHLLSDIPFHARNFISAANHVLKNIEAFDDKQTQKDINPFTLKMFSSIGDRLILNNNIELSFFPITMEKVAESYKFVTMASRLVGQFLPFLLSLRTSLMTPALSFLTDAIELSDLNGKWQALEALSTYIDVVGQLHYPVTSVSIDWIGLTSKAVANALISLPFLSEIDTSDCTVTFREHSGPDKFVLLCCQVLRKLSSLLPAVEFWPCPGFEQIKQLLQVCVICLDRYPTLRFPRKMQLIVSIMTFLQEFSGLRSTSSQDQTIYELWHQIYAIIRTESYFNDLFSVEENPADILGYVETYDRTWNEAVQFFGTCLRQLGRDSINSVISDLSLIFLSDASLTELDWLQVSASVSASLATLYTTDSEHCDAVSSLPGLVLPQLFRAIVHPGMHEPKLLFQLRILIVLLEASLDEFIVLDLDRTEVKCLTDLLTAINQLSPDSLEHHCLLGLGLRIAILLSAFCRSNYMNFTLDIVADAALTVCQLGILDHWLRPLSMPPPLGLATVKGRWVVAGPLVELLRILIRPLSKPPVKEFERNVRGILELARLAICFSWVASPCEGLRLTCSCSRYPRETAPTKAREQVADLQFSFLLQLLRQFDLPLPSQTINSGKIALACHIAQHVSWTIVTSDEVIEFCRLVLTLYAQPDPLHIVSLSDIFGELCANLLPSDPCKWVQVQRELNSGLNSAMPLDGFPHLAEKAEGHCQAAANESLLLRAEALLLTWGTLSRRLSRFQGTEPVSAALAAPAVTIAEENGGIGHASSFIVDAGVSTNCVSVNQSGFVYSDLLREMVAAICRIALAHQHAHCVVGAAYVQIDKLKRALLSLTIFMDLVGTHPVSRMRAKFIATLKLCLRYKFVEPNVVVQLWTMFLKLLEPESLSELLPDVGANLVSLYNIAPERVSEAFANIFVQRRTQLEPVLSKLFYLPALPGLEKFQSVLTEVCPWRCLCCSEPHFVGTNDLLSPPPTELSDLLCAWLSALTHSSRPVRRLCLASLVPPSTSLLSAAFSSVDGKIGMPSGLMNLSRLLVRTLRSLGSGDSTAMTGTEEVTDEGTGLSTIQGHRTSNNATMLFAKLLTCLLMGLTRDSDEEIRLLYSQWLGALGPIDPSRLVLSSDLADTPSTASVESALNWSHLFPFEVLMELAEIYMRAASPKQLDSTALAIQELLRLFAVPGTTSTRSGDVAAASIASSTVDIVNGVSLFISGRDLWMRFPQSVQDLFSPLLSSRYALETFTDWSTIQFPIIGHPSCQSYESWIRLWSGSLKIYVSEPVHYRLFQVCEPVVKSDVEFARYLLNHIALQVLIEGSEIGVAKLRSEVFGVLQLVTGTEKSSLGPDCKMLTAFLLGTSALTENSEPVGDVDCSANWQTWYPLAAQTVFSLLDHLSSWRRARSADRTAAIAACASANSRNSTGILSGGKPTEEEKTRLKDLEIGINRVSEFLEGLPHALQARSSLRMGGLARALRHWESAFAEDKAAQRAVYVTGFVCDRPRDTDAAADGGRGMSAVGSEVVGPAGQEAMTGLLNTYASLHDNDGLSGVLALMQSVGGLEVGRSHLLHPSRSADEKTTVTDNGGTGPAYQTSMLRALQLENEDQLDLACATYEHALATLSTREDSGEGRQRQHQQQQQLGLHVGLFRCQMPDPARLQALLARTDALLRSATQTESIDEARGNDAVEAWTRELNAYRAEAALRLADWDKLDEVVVTTESSRTSWPVGLGKLFLSLKKGSEPRVRSCLNELRLSQMFDLSTAALEGSRGYWRAYEPIVRLGILSEIEVIAGLSAQLTEQARGGVLASDLLSQQRKSDLLIDNLLAWLEARSQQSRPTLHTLEPVLAIRHAALQLVTARLRAAFTPHCPAATSLTPLTRLQRHQLFRLESALADSWLQRAKLARNDLSRVLIPLHRQLVPTLLRPRAPPEEVRDHQPFGSPDRFVCLARLEDNVDILGSQTRPKKMLWIGSDGRRYVIVAKPNDDLRKDSRLMELNGMINKFLMKNPETRRRALQIRTYAVIPLSEKGGLIEWVCNTQPFRSILSKLYIEVNHPINWGNMSRLAPLLEDPLEVKRDKYLNKWLPMYPLVFYRWFLHTFPNPSAWYAARESFARTCAVMSMVGYVLGLGDRHTENILFDSTTGGLVHVDFSCVFNTGLTLPWPERVPFRLTRNLVHAMGPTGYEGIFRRCAEAVMRLLRREVDPLLAVFRPIYFDALVEQGAGRAADGAARRIRRPGNAASAKPVDRITRAAMEKLAGMEDRLRGKITEHDAFGQLLPMSVEGQVDALIKEATSVDRLCQMYKGWMPFM
nr:unnamed protein product [Spirometra erinaceieuropaei]